MMNFAADGLVKERIGTMKNILNRSALFLFVLAFTLLAPQGARPAGYNVMDNDRILLMNNDSKSVNAYIRHCELLQNKNFNIIPTLIYRDKSGKISYKYLDNLDNLRLYKTQDHNFDDFMD